MRSRVSGNSCIKFFAPERCSCFRYSCLNTSFMPVPKTTMHKNNRVITRQNNIRFSGQIFPVQRKAESLAMQHGTHNFFRCSIAPANTRHIPTPSCATDFIRHRLQLSAVPATPPDVFFAHSFLPQNLPPAILSSPPYRSPAPSAVVPHSR